MARLSDERISHLARLALEAVRGGGKIRDERRALLEVKRVLSEHFQLEDQLEAIVRARMPRRVVAGTAEWDILYRRYMEEEIRKVRGG